MRVIQSLSTAAMEYAQAMASGFTASACFVLAVTFREIAEQLPKTVKDGSGIA